MTEAIRAWGLAPEVVEQLALHAAVRNQSVAALIGELLTEGVDRLTDPEQIARRLDREARRVRTEARRVLDEHGDDGLEAGTPAASEQARTPTPVDLVRADPARVNHVLTGHGDDAFDTDRRLAARLEQQTPGLSRALRGVLAFIRRAIRAAAKAGGVAQLAVLGVDYPRPEDLSLPDLHTLAASHLGGPTLYLDSRPLVLAHARASFRGEGVRVVEADPTDPDAVLNALAANGFGNRPTVICLQPLLLERMTDPRRFIRTLVAGLPVGSLLVLTHLTTDHEPDAVAAAVATYRACDLPLTPRSRAELSAMLAHLDLLAPGLVHPHQWHTATTDPDTEPPLPDRSPGPTEPALFHAALAAKPHP
ncbi:SAM-dependent methyltransferase [Nocardia takedensis]